MVQSNRDVVRQISRHSQVMIISTACFPSRRSRGLIPLELGSRFVQIDESSFQVNDLKESQFPLLLKYETGKALPIADLWNRLCLNFDRDCDKSKSVHFRKVSSDIWLFLRLLNSYARHALSNATCSLQFHLKGCRDWNELHDLHFD
jgi:hypothetical protein